MSRNTCAAKKSSMTREPKNKLKVYQTLTSTDPHQIKEIQPSCRFFINKIKTPSTHFSYSEKVEKVGIIWQSVTKILDTH